MFVENTEKIQKGWQGLSAVMKEAANYYWYMTPIVIFKKKRNWKSSHITNKKLSFLFVHNFFITKGDKSALVNKFIKKREEAKEHKRELIVLSLHW